MRSHNLPLDCSPADLQRQDVDHSFRTFDTTSTYLPALSTAEHDTGQHVYDGIFDGEVPWDILASTDAHSAVSVLQFQPDSAHSGLYKSDARHRRQTQNREAQRKFRQRKEKHLATLTSQIVAVTAFNKDLETENRELKDQLTQCEAQRSVMEARLSRRSVEDEAMDKAMNGILRLLQASLLKQTHSSAGWKHTEDNAMKCDSAC